jgi:sec-independent protein translocase protein TatB
MFDVGFSELIVIAIVALVVIGPERLPKVARTGGLLLGRLQRYVNGVKADISREMQIDELKQLQAQMQESARSLESSIRSEIKSVEQVVEQTAQSVEQLVDQTAQSVEQVADPTSQSVEAAVKSVYAPPETVTAPETTPETEAGEAVAAAPAATEPLAASRLRRRIRHIRRREMNDQ